MLQANQIFGLMVSAKYRFSNWLLSIVALAVFPLIPLFIEAVKNSGEIKSENFLLTAAVLAVGYGFASEGNFFRASYLLLFIFSIVLDFKPEVAGVKEHKDAAGEVVGWMGWIWQHPAPMSVIATTATQAIERFNWHIVLNRRFPDWLEKSDGPDSI